MATTFEADGKVAADRDRRELFPATLVVSDSIHDPQRADIPYSDGPKAESPVHQLLDVVNSLKRRTVIGHFGFRIARTERNTSLASGPR